MHQRGADSIEFYSKILVMDPWLYQRGNSQVILENHFALPVNSIKILLNLQQDPTVKDKKGRKVNKRKLKIDVKTRWNRGAIQ